MRILLLCLLFGFWVPAQTIEKDKESDRVLDSTTVVPPKESSDYGRTPKSYLPYGEYQKPYRTFFNEPLQYRGYGRELPDPDLKSLSSIDLGFIGPLNKVVSVASAGSAEEKAMGRSMLQGAQLAIEQANQKGGYKGVPFSLKIHNDNGLWGASGNEIIDMAYREKVWGILGSIDGANSHIAIRVALKCEVPVVNSGDTDPTFVETAIPWVFRCITGDRSMCYLLADFAYKKLGLKRVAALRANNRYGRISIDEFRDASTRSGAPFITELNYQPGETDFSKQLKRIKALKPDGLITYGDAADSIRILKQMREMGIDTWFLASDRLLLGDLKSAVPEAYRHHIAAGMPYNPDWKDPGYEAFCRDYQKAYGEHPGTYAAHAYDGMNILIKAILDAGLNRARIRDALARIETYPGVTGEKSFDDVFSNRSAAYLALWEKDRFVFYSRESIFGD